LKNARSGLAEKLPSLEAPTVQEHAEIRRKYVVLAWDLWRQQREVNFYVWHPLPEEHLRIEVALFWRGEIAHVHGFTDILGQIGKAIGDIFRGIFDWFWLNVIRPGIDALLSVVRWVLDGINSVVNGIAQTVGSVWNAVVQGVAGIVTRIGEGVGWLAGELTKAVGWIWDQFKGFFSAIADVLKQIGTWIINAIRTLVVDPILAGLGAIFDTIRALISGIWNFITGGIMTHSPQEWRGSYLRWLGVITGVSVLAVSGFIGAAIADVIHPLKDTRIKEVAEFALRFSGMTFLQGAFFTTFFDVATAKPVRQELNAIFRPEVPSIGEATRMLWRGKISEADFDGVIAVQGYGEPWAAGYKALTENLPGSGDLILFVVREVITPDQFTKVMALQGFSKTWADAYWEAHWILPPPERTRTAFLRKQIPDAEYRKFLVWYDFKPDPRPGISLSDVDIMLKTQYDWPGRIDMRWLAEWGEITPEQLTELLKSEGMDPSWAPRVASVWILNQLREELSKVRGVYERRLREGFMSKVAFAEALHSLHYAVHVVNALSRWADEELVLAEKVELAAEYKKLALEGLISIELYGQDLRELGMVEERITREQKHVETLLGIKAAKAAAKKG